MLPSSPILDEPSRHSVARETERQGMGPKANCPHADKGAVSSSPGLQPVVGDPKHAFRFVARQPILNREQQVLAYELLFRDGIENFFRATDAAAAARSTLDSTLL